MGGVQQNSNYYAMPDMCFYPQAASFAAEYILNQVLLGQHSPEQPPLLSAEEAVDLKQLKRDALLDGNHLLSLSAQRTQLNNWELTARLYTHEIPSYAEMTEYDLGERQVLSLLCMFQQDAEHVAAYHALEKEFCPQPQPQLEAALWQNRALGETPYLMTTKRLMLPPILPCKNDDAYDIQIENHFEPIEKTYEMRHIRDVAEHVMTNAGLKALLTIRHATQFVAMHMPQRIGNQFFYERYGIFAMKPFDSGAPFCITKSFQSAALALEACEKSYILPAYKADPNNARLPENDILHYSKCKPATTLFPPHFDFLQDAEHPMIDPLKTIRHYIYNSSRDQGCVPGMN